MRLCISAIVSILAAMQPLSGGGWGDASAGRPILEFWTEAEYHASENNHVVIRDRQGRVYVGNGGVITYDGREWSKIDINQAYGTRCLTLDEENRIWVGAINELGYLDDNASGQRHYHSLTHMVPEGVSIPDVWGVHRLHEKTLFVLTNGILVWDGQAFSYTPLPAETRLFSFPFRGGIGISQKGRGFWKWDGSQLLPVTLGGAEAESIAFVVPLKDGSEFLDPGKRLMRLKNGQLERVATNAVPILENNAQLTMALPLPDGKICVVSFSRGVVILNPDLSIARIIDRSAGLPGLNCNRVYLDDRGNLWIATQLAVIRTDAFASTSLFDKVNGFDAGRTISLGINPDRILALAAEGVLELRSSAELYYGASFKPVPGLGEIFFDSMRNPDGSILLSGLFRIMRLEGAAAHQAYTADSQVDRLEPWKGPLLVASDGLNIQLLERGDQPRLVRTLLSNLPETVSDIAIDGRETLWIALSKNGIYSLDLSRPDAPVRMRGMQPSATFSAPPNDARFFVLDGDAYVFNEREIHQLPVETETATTVQLDGIGLAAAERRASGTIWAAARSENDEQRLVRITRQTSGLEMQEMEFNGLRSIGRTWSITREPHSTILWAGGTQGILRTDRAALQEAPDLSGPVILRAAWHPPSSETRPLTAGTTPQLPFESEGTFVFEIRDGHDILRKFGRMECRLTGAETRWTTVDGPRTFSGLREGAYTLEARAVGLAGDSGPLSSFSFVIRPPWHRSLWAYGSYLATAAAVVYAGVRLRLKRIARLNAELEQLVNTRTEELTRAVAARSAFLATMGHEIRNPLNGVIGLVDALRARQLDSDQRAFVDRIENCANQLVVAVEDVLEFARIDAGRVPVRLRPFPLREPVDGAIDIFHASGSDAVIVLQLDTSDPEERIVGDPDRIRQVLVNYIANAIKFGGGGGVTVTVAVRDGFLRISVADRGPGIPKDEQARLFVRFSRGTLAYKSDIPGTGLGLAACKAYAEAMGGEVWVESELGRGSTFYLRLPHRPATEANSVPTVVAPDIMVGRVALVVDDHEFNRVVLSDLLGRMGAKALTAADVPEAKDVFQADLPDIVFVDFDLPGSSGADLARWIRTEASAGRDIPIVATSAFEVDEIRRKCVDAGMDGFIAKPVTPQKVAEVMSRIETLRGGGMNCFQAAAATPARGSFLDLLSDGDPQRRKHLERNAWREVLAEALEAFRGVRAGDQKKAAQRSHRLVSSALMLGLKDVVAAARELTEAAKSGNGASVASAAEKLRFALNATRAQRKE